MKRGALLPAVILLAAMACSTKERTHTTEPPPHKGLSLFPVDAPGEVTALANTDGSLIAAGICETPVGYGRLYVVRWDGDSWTTLADTSNSDAPVRIFTLHEYKGDLLAAGKFTSLQGVPANNIARWDGAAWRPMAGGLRGTVKSLVTFNGELLAGGALSPFSYTEPEIGLARWNGQMWEELYPPDGGVEAMGLYRGALIASWIDRNAACYITSWVDSKWDTLAADEVFDGAAAAMIDYQDELIMGGVFVIRGVNPAAESLARWDGSLWHGMGSINDLYAQIYALAIYNGDLIVGGSFWRMGGRVVNGLARWDGMQWKEWSPALGSGPGVPAVVEALTVWDGALIMGGQLYISGPDSINWIARWDD